MSPLSEHSGTPFGALHALVLDLFTAEEFRRWLRMGPDARILPEIPGETVADATVIEKALGVLIRQGRIDAAFFARMIDVRERKSEAIARVAALWEDEPTKVSRSPRESSPRQDAGNISSFSGTPADDAGSNKVDRILQDPASAPSDPKSSAHLRPHRPLLWLLGGGVTISLLSALGLPVLTNDPPSSNQTPTALTTADPPEPRARHQAEEAEGRAAEAKLRQAQEEARRTRGRPGGAPCAEWLLQRIRVEVPAVNPNGGEWDPNNDRPDLHIRLRIGTQSRETNYIPDATVANFDMHPTIPMSAGEKIQMTAWDYDGAESGWFSSSVARDLAVSVSEVIPNTIPTSGLRMGHARGTFYIFADCADP